MVPFLFCYRVSAFIIFLHSLQMINIFETDEKVTGRFDGLIISSNITHQLVGYCWVTKEVMNRFFFHFDESIFLFLESFYTRKKLS